MSRVMEPKSILRIKKIYQVLVYGVFYIPHSMMFKKIVDGAVLKLFISISVVQFAGHMQPMGPEPRSYILQIYEITK